MFTRFACSKHEVCFKLLSLIVKSIYEIKFYLEPSILKLVIS